MTDPPKPATLTEIMSDAADAAARSAIARALKVHATVTAAAESLGTTARALRRAAQRLGVEMGERRPGRPRNRTP